MSVLNDTQAANIQRVLSRLAYVFDQTKPDYYDPARNTPEALVREYERTEAYVRLPMSAAFQFKHALIAELPLHKEHIQTSQNFPLHEVLGFFEEEAAAVNHLVLPETYQTVAAEELELVA